MSQSLRELQSVVPFMAGLRWRYGLGALLLVITNACALLIPWLLKLAIDGLQTGSGGLSPSNIAIIICLVACLYAVVRTFSRTVLFNAARLIEYQMRDRLLSRLLTLDSRLAPYGGGAEVLSRFSNDLMNVRMLLGFGCMSIVNAVIVYGAALWQMVRLDLWLTVLAVAPLPLMVIAVRMISERIFQASLASQEKLGGLTAFSDETVKAVRMLKSYRREQGRGEQFATMSRDYRAQNLVLGRLRGFIMPVTALATGLGMVAVVYVGGGAVAAGRMSLGGFVAFTGYLALLVWPTAMLGWIITLVQRGAASMTRLNQVLFAPPALEDIPDAQELVTRQAVSLDFKDVSVVIHGRKLLDHITFQVPAGSRVGITGPVGCGKSTLLRLLLRLQAPSSGRIDIDGVALEQYTIDSLRSRVGYVPQDAQLFSRSIAENIRYGGDNSLELALAEAGLAKDVASFSDGIHTVIGERGITLSGGQRQRVALARVLAGAPSLLLLDDPLASVDVEREEAILATLRDAGRGKTVLIVSQRVSAFKDCAIILYLEDGKLVECDTPQALLAHPSRYRRLVEMQAGVLPDDALFSCGGLCEPA